MYLLKEKILLLSALFHDIGKFQQICLSEDKDHTELGARFIKENSTLFKPLFGNDEQAFQRLCKVIEEHHVQNSDDELIKIIDIADKVSAEENHEDGNYGSSQKKHFLLSTFSNVNLLSKKEKSKRYYRHEKLTKKNYEVLIPQKENIEDAAASQKHYKNQDKIFDEFKNDLRSVFKYYKGEEDFETLVNLILIVFEKYLWCIPNIVGNDESDISLFNHLKDVTAVSHALYKTRYKNNDSTKLNLIIGEMPGIQKYIFDVTGKKPAKILRGRSIYVQLLTRHFASIILKELGLTETSLIMFAGGKFYIIAQQNESFKKVYNCAKGKIEKFLIKNFFYEIKFSSAYVSFDADTLASNNIKFSDIIDNASYELLKGRHQIFKNDLFPDSFDERKFVLPSDYIKTKDLDSNSVKCKVSDKPVRKDRAKEIEDVGLVDKQVFNEYKIGKDIPYGAVVLELSNELDEVKKIKKLDAANPDINNYKIIINPSLDDLISYSNSKRNLLKNSLILEVANYTSMDEDDYVKDFDEMVKVNHGAEFLTLIKGDIDNLGLLMSCGLSGSTKEASPISRITTMSYHLKYFFSFFINGFLEKWDRSKKELDKDHPESDQNVYTIFAGGDDLMLITTQSASLKLVKEFNEQFKDFICENDEVHITYSHTNFKDHTPIRMVADISEHHQEAAKKKLKGNSNFDSLESFLNSSEPFSQENDKTGLYLFNSIVKNSSIQYVLDRKNELTDWVKDENNPVSKGVTQTLLNLAEMMKEYDEEQKIEKLIWHPKLANMITRLLMDKGGYKNEAIQTFFDEALTLNKNLDSPLRAVLHPLMCEVIYSTRNLTGENNGEEKRNENES
jgi:CRISPR-associated protein Csm1